MSKILINKAEIKRILLIRTDRIGDVILTLPMIEVLKQNFPEAEIDFLVNERVAGLIYNYPNITNLLTIENDSMKALRQVIPKNKYDLAIAVRPLFNIALAIYDAKIDYRLGTAYRWYSYLFNLRHKQHRKHSIKHELEYNLDLLTELNCEIPANINPKLYTTFEDEKSMLEKLVDKGMNLDKKIIVIHITSLGSALVWSKENFTELLNLLVCDKDLQFNIVLTGTNSDEVKVKAVLDRVENKQNIYGIFDLNLKELTLLIKKAEIFIGNSTGPIHIAAAVDTHIVGFYSPRKTESETRWGPWTENKKIFTLSETDNNIPASETVYNYIKTYLTKKETE